MLPGVTSLIQNTRAPHKIRRTVAGAAGQVACAEESIFHFALLGTGKVLCIALMKNCFANQLVQ